MDERVDGEMGGQVGERKGGCLDAGKKAWMGRWWVDTFPSLRTG